MSSVSIRSMCRSHCSWTRRCKLTAIVPQSSKALLLCLLSAVSLCQLWPENTTSPALTHTCLWVPIHQRQMDGQQPFSAPGCCPLLRVCFRSLDPSERTSTSRGRRTAEPPRPLRGLTDNGAPLNTVFIRHNAQSRSEVLQAASVA